jgi:hypothetical protein
MGKRTGIVSALLVAPPAGAQEEDPCAAPPPGAIVGTDGKDVLVGTAESATTTLAATTTTTAAGTTATAGPMTGKELVWLERIRKLHTRIDKVLTNSPPT